MVVHGFIDIAGNFITLDDPNGTNTMLLGLNNVGQVVGSYVDGNGETQGLIYDLNTKTWLTISDPNASGMSAFGVNGTTVTSANILQTIDNGLTTLNSNRSNFGAAMNRLQDASTAITTTQNDLSAALGTIQDVDVASETANLAREQVLAQAGAAVLAQANQTPQLALKLLGG